MKHNQKNKEMTTTDLTGLILNGGEQADEAMYHLLHHQLNHQLMQRFEVYQHQLLDEFEDIVDDFFFYLREGKEGENQQTYPSLRNIEKRELFAITSVCVPQKKRSSRLRNSPLRIWPNLTPRLLS